jgi:hypothetical protein
MGSPTRKNEQSQPPTTCAIIRGLKEIKERFPDFSLAQVVFDP